MATVHQRASYRRKLIYLGLIFGLFVVNTFFWRGVAGRAGGSPPNWTVTAQANDLELREVTQGDAEISGSALRLALTGSRGLATTILWSAAIEKQKRNEWNKLESNVQTLTKLQPHFLTPWLFQSWNLAYNVSVENDRVKDKFFYITRGMELLAEGERLNKNHPDMRYWMGFYYQMKFGQAADEANTLKSLFQMSCIDPLEREPEALLTADGKSVDLEKFEKFCREHPQLVRRLRDNLRCNSPADVVDFLRENQGIPCRYYDPKQDNGLFAGAPHQLKPANQQFPILPLTAARTSPSEPTPDQPLRDDFDNFLAARAWFALAQDPLPEPEVMKWYRSRDEKLRDPNFPKDKRLPRQPAEVIFRCSPARAQSYHAEQLEKEGWFTDAGWAIDAGRTGAYRWFPDKEMVVGAGRSWAVDAWNQAYAMWQDYGRKSGMYLDATEAINLEEIAKPLRTKYNIFPDNDLRGGLNAEDRDDPVMIRSLEAHRQFKYYLANRDMTNYGHHYYRAAAERDVDTVNGRRALFEAEKFKLLSASQRAMRLYEEGFRIWTTVLARYPEFRNDQLLQEDVYEFQIHYMQLLEKFTGPQLLPGLVTADVLAQAMALGTQGAYPADAVAFALRMKPQALPFPLVGPLDQLDPQGQPWVSPEIAKSIRSKLGLDDEPKPAPPQTNVNIGSPR